MEQTQEKSLIPFDFEDQLVRVQEIDGDIWFVAKDVCNALEYKNIRESLRKIVDAEDKGVTISDTPGGKQELTIINESGLYSLILRSRKEEAKKFKRWVTAEVLPTIRKKGHYIPNSQTVEYTKQLEQRILDLEKNLAKMLEKDTGEFMDDHDIWMTLEEVVSNTVDKIAELSDMTLMTSEYLLRTLLRKLGINSLDDLRIYHMPLLERTLDEMEEYCRHRAEIMDKILETATEFMTASEIAEKVGTSTSFVRTICNFLDRKGYIETSKTVDESNRKRKIRKYKKMSNCDDFPF